MSAASPPPDDPADVPAGAPAQAPIDGAGDLLEELVFQVLERWESAGDSGVDELCDAHPELASRLRSRVAALRDAGLLGDVVPGADEIPERLGEFRLLQRLGGGGMGVVYRAEQSSLGRTVALKLVRPEQLFFAGSRERFRREVEAVARLAHPGIVPVYSVGEERGLPYFAMECVEGVSLATVIEAFAGRDPASLGGADLQALLRERLGGASTEEASPVFAGSWADTCLRVVRQVAEALEHAHRRGVLHRDVKPSNVMLTAAGRAMLLDFGLASLEGNSRLTRTGAQLGSVPYMPPELVRGELDAFGPAQDVYSLGVTLYELLTLRLPFDGDSQEDMRRLIVEARPLPPRRIDASLATDAEVVCLAAMDPGLERRYPSAEAFARDISCVLERRPIEARRAGPWLRARRWVQRRPAAAAALALALLLVLGGPTGYAVVQQRANADLLLANQKVAAANADLELALGLAEERRQEAEREWQRAEDESAQARLNAAEAEAQRARAERQRERADDERGRADDERARAEQQRALAEENFSRALAAVDLMLLDLGENRLDQVPEMQPLRLDFVDHAARLYDELLEQRPDGPLRAERVRLDRVRGDVLMLMGRLAEAEAAYHKCIEGYAEVLRDHPDDVLVEILAAQVLNPLASVLDAQGRRRAARDARVDGAQRFLELNARVPNQPVVIHDLAATLLGLGISLRAEGDSETALATWGEAARILRPMTRSDTIDALMAEAVGAPLGTMDSMLADLLGFMALVAGNDLGRLHEARGCFDESHELNLRVARLRPQDRDAQANLCEDGVNGAELLGPGLAQWEAAERLAREGLAAARWLNENHSDVPEMLKWEPAISTSLGRVLFFTGRLDEARSLLAAADEGMRLVAESASGGGVHEYFAELPRMHGGHIELHLGLLDAGAAKIEGALAALRALWRAHADDPPVRTNLRIALVLLAEVRAWQGRTDEAQALLDEARPLRSDASGILMLDEAGVWLRCAEHAAAEGDAPAADAWRARALELLEEVAPGLPAPRLLLDHPDLAPLRGEPRFEELAARTGA